MQNDVFSDEVWVPVNVRGYGLRYEMCPMGYVRGAAAQGAMSGLWLLPEESDAGPVYRLDGGGREEGTAELAARDIVALFGGRAPDGPSWGRTLRARALAENALARGVRLGDDVRARVERGVEGFTLSALLDTLGRGCPWERARIQGDARDADPVLGY